jgi:hypothetical protein
MIIQAKSGGGVCMTGRHSMTGGFLGGMLYGFSDMLQPLLLKALSRFLFNHLSRWHRYHTMSMVYHSARDCKDDFENLSGF